MKRLAFILPGALLGGVVGYGIIVLATRVFEMHFAKGQDDMSQFAGVLVIVVFPLSLLLGGWLSHSFHGLIARRAKQGQQKSQTSE